MPEQDAPQQRPHGAAASAATRILHQAALHKNSPQNKEGSLSRAAARLGLESVNYGDAILTDNWPRDGLLLARSTVAENRRAVQDRPPQDPGGEHVPAVVAGARHCGRRIPGVLRPLQLGFRPKVDAVAVVFLNPWWSAEVKDNAGESRMFELEAVEAKATHAAGRYLRRMSPPRHRNPSRKQ